MTFHAFISRPVDNDTDDTYRLSVVVTYAPRSECPEYLSAEVTEDVYADDGTIVVHRGEVIDPSDFAPKNIEALDYWYTRHCQASDDYYPDEDWQPENEVQFHPVEDWQLAA